MHTYTISKYNWLQVVDEFNVFCGGKPGLNNSWSDVDMWSRKILGEYKQNYL
jgi:hypothetical protein